MHKECSKQNKSIYIKPELKIVITRGWEGTEEDI